MIIKKMIFWGIWAFILSLLLPIRIEADTQKLSPEEPRVGFVTASYISRTELWRNNAKTVYEDEDWPDITRIIEYEGVEAQTDIPQEVGGEAWSPELETAGRGSLVLTELRELSNEDGSARSRWQDDFSMVVTFRDYGAETYELNGKRISHQEESPPLWGSEEALLGLIGGSTSDYQITEIEWLGERYTDDFGILYRNARVTGLRKVSDYRAVYQGKAIAPRILQTTEREQKNVEREKEPEESEPKELEQENDALETLFYDGMSETKQGPIAETISYQEESLPDSCLPEAALDGESMGQPSQNLSFVSVKNDLIRLSKKLESWIYERLSIYIPIPLILGTGMVFGSAIAFWRIRAIDRRKDKNSL